MESHQTPAPTSASPVSPGPSLTPKALGSNHRFHGDGVRYKAKLIGIDHVISSEGQKMCHDSMMKLKGFEAVFRKQGRHKQRVWLKICSGGLRILDEKTAGEMYVHDRSEISSLTRDESDPRALAYVHSHAHHHYLFYLRTANAAEPVLNDIREVCLSVDQEPDQEPPSEPPQSEVLLVMDEASTLPSEEITLEKVHSPGPDANIKSNQTSTSELAEVFSIPLKDPIEATLSYTAASGPEPDLELPKPALSNSQILSMFSPQPGGAAYPSSPWLQQGIVGPQWAGPMSGAAVTPWPSAMPPTGPAIHNMFHHEWSAPPAQPTMPAQYAPPNPPPPPAADTPPHGGRLLL